MAKVLMGSQPMICPMSKLLIGANVDDKPNFTTVSWGGFAHGEPRMISVAILNERHTLQGIRESLTFSVNMPSRDMVKETDYSTATSGSKVDEVEVYKVEAFYGKLSSAPLVEQCPINLECKVMHILDLENHSLVIGRIEKTLISDDCITDYRTNFVLPIVLLFFVGTLDDEACHETLMQMHKLYERK